MQTDQYKKTFIPLMEYLINEDKEKPLRQVLPEIEKFALTSRTVKRKPRQTNAIRNTAGEVVAIKCEYFDRYMPLVGDLAVEFGVKTSHPSGYNPKCKEGLNIFNKKKKEYDNTMSSIAKNMPEDPAAFAQYLEDAKQIREEAEIERVTMPFTDLGFATLEELEDYLKANNIEL